MSEGEKVYKNINAIINYYNNVNQMSGYSVSHH